MPGMSPMAPSLVFAFSCSELVRRTPVSHARECDRPARGTQRSKRVERKQSATTHKRYRGNLSGGTKHGDCLCIRSLYYIYSRRTLLPPFRRLCPTVSFLRSHFTPPSIFSPVALARLPPCRINPKCMAVIDVL
ncbi:hypothetical protein BCR44DRAFT_1191766 [Catenaria anguillulae PL171]|uniref:Uncharacterized protein n=1 Tax=Catenaria anguillulae PL171 TaxID=765915 RepID=A0A1Y2HH33_9FUNG|nr:hypothetical protein BCR44DRAFT_1191766 [Catenaria anguillulae PL171]